MNLDWTNRSGDKEMLAQEEVSTLLILNEECAGVCVAPA